MRKFILSSLALLAFTAVSFSRYPGGGDDEPGDEPFIKATCGGSGSPPVKGECKVLAEWNRITGATTVTIELAKVVPAQPGQQAQNVIIPGTLKTYNYTPAQPGGLQANTYAADAVNYPSGTGVYAVVTIYDIAGNKLGGSPKTSTVFTIP